MQDKLNQRIQVLLNLQQDMEQEQQKITQDQNRLREQLQKLDAEYNKNNWYTSEEKLEYDNLLTALEIIQKYDPDTDPNTDPDTDPD